ncbi:MAG: hypothetical protein BECKG1743D_GA0114223_100343 [Candidatus Kentron sp. G]|nr:MAG: hypothetical protein BECKG1743D_GA0114223_100343 [Candidatus Kentron sp. G]VFM97910.1 MAG: hypothetical protein BECKG1743F_GA0114225_102782 [Candidatus Kentron sp. G]
MWPWNGSRRCSGAACGCLEGIPTGNNLGDFYQRIYQLACLYRPASYVAITVTSFTMRLPRALNPDENPTQFGIFFSANRLTHLGFVFRLWSSRDRYRYRYSLSKKPDKIDSEPVPHTTIRRFLVFCERFRPWPCRMLVSPPGRTASEFIDQRLAMPINEF